MKNWITRVVNAVIGKGTLCKHGACSAAFVDDSSRTAQCIYHPGYPIFHEGSKGWTCCRRRVLEFDEFLKIEGCSTGKHKFIETKKKSEDEQVQCRYDWYQIASQVILSVYAKKVNKTESKIEFEEHKVPKVTFPLLISLSAENRLEI